MIKKLLLVTLITFGMTNELGTSFSVRTPNDDDKPLDYEYSIKVEDTEGNVQYLLKRDWERELGEKYIDDIAKFSHQVYDCFYYGVDYVNKESKDIFYTTYNIGITDKGFKAGLSVKDDVKLFSLGYNKKLKQDDIEYVVGLSFKSDLGENNIINLKSEVKKWFTEKVNVFALYKHEYYNKQEDFQFKVGLGVKL
jgi:hypothetical protein